MESRHERRPRGSRHDRRSPDRPRDHDQDRHRRERRRDDRPKARDEDRPQRRRERSPRSRSPVESRRRSPPDERRRRYSPPDKSYRWGKPGDEREKKPDPDKEKPNFGLSGKLTAETNTYRGVVIKYSEPPEACKPKRRWRLYPFKGEKALPTLYIHRESAYLMGREVKIVDFPLEHPSCSKQHAVLQYRLVPFTRKDGSQGKKVRPYIIDLESANGTFLNNEKLEARKYYELFEKDVLKFGFSSREYVLLHENSKDEAQDDDVKDEEVKDEEVFVKKEEPAG